MRENKDLVLTGPFHNFFVADLVHEHHTLDCFLLGDPNIDLFKRDRPVRLIKNEKT